MLVVAQRRIVRFQLKEVTLEMGYVYLYTGTGGGKTANALGLALRSVGHSKKVVVIQFLKWRKDIGEYLIINRLAPYYEIYQFGREAWLGEEERTEEFTGEKFEVECIKKVDKKLAKKGLVFAEKIMREKKPSLLILDEVGLAAEWKLVEVNDVLELLDSVPKETSVVLTGRLAPKELAERADFVNIVQQVKMPEEFKPTKGIQY
jgi:cob(I)alamin adenosyltransferase